MSAATSTRDLVAALGGVIEGEVDSSARVRAEYSTDASNYRVPPAVVAFPRHVDDLVAIAAFARENAVLPATVR